VLSRMRRGIFVVGGRDPGSGAWTGEVWFARIGAASWEFLPVGVRPERVLAATYSFRDDSLYVLDETEAGLRRLWTQHLRDQTSTLLGSWTVHAEWDRHWLVSDMDGAILLASSSGASKRHAVARIEPMADGTYAMAGIERGGRALALAPVVDAGGYALLVRKTRASCEDRCEHRCANKCDGKMDHRQCDDCESNCEAPCPTASGRSVIRRVRRPYLELEPASLSDLGAQL